MWSKVALNSAPECWNHRSEPPYMAPIQVEAGSAIERLESGVEGYVHRVCVQKPALVLGGHQSHKSWRYKQMLATMWVGADAKSSANAVNCQVFSQIPK